MFKKGQISTEVDKGPFIFTLTALTVGLIVTVLLFALAFREPLAVFAGILMAIVSSAAGAVLFAMVTDRAYIDKDTLCMSYLFRKRSVKISDISSITLKDDVYHVFLKNGAEAGTINSKLTAIGDLIFALDKNGVNFT